MCHNHYFCWNCWLLSEPSYNNFQLFQNTGMHLSITSVLLITSFKSHTTEQFCAALFNLLYNQCIQQKLQYTFKNAVSCSQPFLPKSTSQPTWPPQGMLCLLKAPHTSCGSARTASRLSATQVFPRQPQALLAVIWSSWAIPRGSKVCHDNCTHSGDKRARNNMPQLYHIHVCVCECVWKKCEAPACTAMPRSLLSLVTHQLPSL